MGGAIPSGMQTTLHRMNGSVIQPVALPPDGRIIWRVPGGVDQVVWRTQAIISGYTYTNEMSLFRSLKKDYDTHMIDFTYTGLNVFAPIISIGEYKPDTDEFTYRTPLK